MEHQGHRKGAPTTEAPCLRREGSSQSPMGREEAGHTTKKNPVGGQHSTLEGREGREIRREEGRSQRESQGNYTDLLLDLRHSMAVAAVSGA